MGELKSSMWDAVWESANQEIRILSAALRAGLGMVSSALSGDRLQPPRPGKWRNFACCRSETLQFWKVGGVEAAVSSKEGVSRGDGVGADKEVGDDAFARSAAPARRYRIQRVPASQAMSVLMGESVMPISRKALFRATRSPNAGTNSA